MKRLSETARVYQLQHGHTMIGTLKHGETITQFKYGLLHDNRNKTTYVHGIEGGQTQTEIETVCDVSPEVGDKITLVTNRKGRVTNVSTEILDELQLRFVPYEKADKIKRITIQYL